MRIQLRFERYDARQCRKIHLIAQGQGEVASPTSTVVLAKRCVGVVADGIHLLFEEAMILDILFASH